MPEGKQARVKAEQPRFQQAGIGHFLRKEKRYQTAIRAWWPKTATRLDPQDEACGQH